VRLASVLKGNPLLGQAQAKGKWTLNQHKLVAAWMSILLTFQLATIYTSWVLANIMTSWLSLWLAFGNVAEPQGADFHIIVFQKIWADYIYTYIYTAIFVRSWWSEWGVVAATHCHSWWRWWANTLWVTLTRVVTTTLSYQYVNFGLAGTVKITVYFKQSFIVEFSLQSHICNLLNELVEKIQCSELTVTLLSVLWSVMGKTASECLSVWLVLNLMLIFSHVIG